MNILRKSAKYILLSYILSERTKGYGKAEAISIEPLRQLDKGNSCNTSMLHFNSHAGTHIDFSRHFSNLGKTVEDYSIEDFIFKKPCFIDCQKAKNEMIVPDDIVKFHNQLKKCDILILRTGFFRFRGKYPYYINNPGIAPETAMFIRRQYLNIKCVGIDTISISPYQKRDLGRKTHRIFLKGQLPILLIEDMDLSRGIKVLKRIKVLIVSPLFITGPEAVPCTVIGFM